MVNNIAPLKTARIINTSNKWFDRDIAKKLSISHKLFERFKSSLFSIDRTIKQKKKQYLEEKLSENMAKSKELWQTLKSLGLPKQKEFSFEYITKMVYHSTHCQ